MFGNWWRSGNAVVKVKGVYKRVLSPTELAMRAAAAKDAADRAHQQILREKK